MQKRICEKCKTDWYSSDTRGIWVCGKCGNEISVPNICPNCLSQNTWIYKDRLHCSNCYSNYPIFLKEEFI
jgi:primosomal protein N'